MDKETIVQEFEALKLTDVTVHKVWEAYQYGDIGSHTEALKYMVVLLAREKRDLNKRLLEKVIREPIIVKVDCDPNKDYGLKEFRELMEENVFSSMGVSEKYLK